MSTIQDIAQTVCAVAKVVIGLAICLAIGYAAISAIVCAAIAVAYAVWWMGSIVVAALAIFGLGYLATHVDDYI